MATYTLFQSTLLTCPRLSSQDSHQFYDKFVLPCHGSLVTQRAAELNLGASWA